MGNKLPQMWSLSEWNPDAQASFFTQYCYASENIQPRDLRRGTQDDPVATSKYITEQHGPELKLINTRDNQSVSQLASQSVVKTNIKGNMYNCSELSQACNLKIVHFQLFPYNS